MGWAETLDKNKLILIANSIDGCPNDCTPIDQELVNLVAGVFLLEPDTLTIGNHDYDRNMYCELCILGDGHPTQYLLIPRNYTEWIDTDWVETVCKYLRNNTVVRKAMASKLSIAKITTDCCFEFLMIDDLDYVHHELDKFIQKIIQHSNTKRYSDYGPARYVLTFSDGSDISINFSTQDGNEHYSSIYINAPCKPSKKVFDFRFLSRIERKYLDE